MLYTKYRVLMKFLTKHWRAVLINVVLYWTLFAVFHFNLGSLIGKLIVEYPNTFLSAILVIILNLIIYFVTTLPEDR